MNNRQIRTGLKPISILLPLVLSAVALAGCDLFSLRGSTPSVSSAPTAFEYARFAPASRREFDEGVAEGWVSRNMLIAKATASFREENLKACGVELVGSFEAKGFRYLYLKAGDDTLKRAAGVRRIPGILYVEHELISKLPEDEAGPTEDPEVASRDALRISRTLNDPETWGRYGHFETTHALDAYDTYGFGDTTVYVADIDTGINWTHEDFQDTGGTIVARAMSAFDSADGGASFAFVGGGYNFVPVPAGENWDEEGHGTHTAGTIAALGNNGIGVAGVAWDKVKLISYKCFSNNTNYGSGSDWAIYGGLYDLAAWKDTENIDQTIPVNMSLGGKYAGAFEQEMIMYALENDIVIIASMGNDGTRRSKYPAAYAGVIAVGAARANGEKVGFSTSGNHISVSAPGYCIYSTSAWGDQSYEDMSGTSMATPFVTGLVAYMLTFEPNLTASQIRSLLEETATDIGPAGWDTGTGYGMVDVRAAIKRVVDHDIPADGQTYSSGMAQVQVNNINGLYGSNCSDPGTNADALGGVPVYLYDGDGNFVTYGTSNYTDGISSFGLLKPGTYTAKAIFHGVTESATFAITATADAAATIEFDVPVVYVETLYNDATDSQWESSADTVITVYSDTGEVVAGPYDYYYLDTLEFVPVPGTTYRIGIEPYIDMYYSKGEYGLYVGTNLLGSCNTTNGRGAGADDTFEENDSFDTAQAISYATQYGLYLGDADYFTVTIPATP